MTKRPDPAHHDDYAKLDYDVYARTRPVDDLWGQVRRTVKGEPVSAEQIHMIVNAIQEGLDLTAQDALLDLACGNGALSCLLFDSCKQFMGVDLSAYLIAIAKKHYEAAPKRRFMEMGAAQYVRQEARPERFSKVLCYGSFSYFSNEDATEVLQQLFQRYRNVQRIFIGNLPDKDRAHNFYKEKAAGVNELSDHASQIGIWRSKEEFSALAAAAGWRAKFSNLPEAFFAAHYRYDVLLSR